MKLSVWIALEKYEAIYIYIYIRASSNSNLYQFEELGLGGGIHSIHYNVVMCKSIREKNIYTD